MTNTEEALNLMIKGNPFLRNICSIDSDYNTTGNPPWHTFNPNIPSSNANPGTQLTNEEIETLVDNIIDDLVADNDCSNLGTADNVDKQMVTRTLQGKNWNRDETYLHLKDTLCQSSGG
jgi:hypothetical protein